MSTVFEEMMTESALDLNGETELCETCLDHGHDDCVCGDAESEEENEAVVKDFSNPEESIEAQLARLKARKAAKIQEDAEQAEIDAIQAEAEAMDDDDEAKAAKKSEAKAKRAKAARARFLKKRVESTYTETIPEHTRTYRTKPAQASSFGEEVEMLVLESNVTVLVGFPQPDAPQIQANANASRGGRKLSTDEDGPSANMIGLKDLHKDD